MENEKIYKIQYKPDGPFIRLPPNVMIGDYFFVSYDPVTETFTGVKATTVKKVVTQ